ncbi:S-adenosylmethionine-dependent methyltransferase [Xanthoria calcicola]
MLPTPSTSHVDFDRVYEPAEDSFLLLDTLSSTNEVSFLTERFGRRNNGATRSTPPLVVEIGTGSGVVLAFLTAHAETLFGISDILSLGIDINHSACKASLQTVEKACGDVTDGLRDAPRQEGGTGFLLTAVIGDLASAIRPGSADVLIFNPPYVPTSDVPTAFAADGEKQACLDADSDMLSLSYAGGIDGMEVTNRLLEQLPSVLNADRGIAYILLCKQNKPDEVTQRIRQWDAPWRVDVVGQSGRQGGWEKLQILRIRRGS